MLPTAPSARVPSETTRERIVFAINMMIGVLKYNPKAALKPKCRDARVPLTLIDELVEMGALVAVENKGGKRQHYKWAGEPTAEAAFEKLILARRAKEEARKQAEIKAAAEAAAKATPPAAPSFAALRTDLDTLARRVKGLSEEVQILDRRPKTAPLSKDDTDLLNAIMDDNVRISNENAQLLARLNNLEEMVRGLCSRSAGKQPDGGLVELTHKLRLGVIGIHGRDHQHLLDSLTKHLGPKASAVELVFIDHTPGRVDIPSTLDGVIVTKNGHKRGMEAQGVYPKHTYHLRGTGISSVVNLVGVLLGGAMQAAA